MKLAQDLYNFEVDLIEETVYSENVSFFFLPWRVKLLRNEDVNQLWWAYNVKMECIEMEQCTQQKKGGKKFQIKTVI